MQEDKAFKIFNSNLKYLMEQNNISQRNLAKLTGVSVATVHNYLSGLMPSVNFLIKIKELYGIGLDEIIYKNISNANILNGSYLSLNLKKFCGTFIAYFYDSSEYKGKVSNLSKNTLRYAVISFLPNEKTSELTAIANFFKSKDDAENFKNSIENENLNSNKIKAHESTEQCYKGKLEASLTQIFIYLKSDELNDHCLIILNNPPSNKNYIGGLGTANSVSRGREHMPCLQFMLISKRILNIPDGEMYNMLSLGLSDVNVETQAEQLLNLFKNLYINSVNLSEELSEFQKRKIFENSLNNILEDLIDANLFRFAKVSNREDDDYYRIIKEE